MNIQIFSNDKVSRFAEKELKSYLSRMGCPNLDYKLNVTDLSIYGLEKVSDNDLDDQYYINVNDTEQIIIGNNPRALLLGCYRYLTLIGCRFLRPGKQFEIIPVYQSEKNFFAEEKHSASLRHRGVCLEGFDSIDNIVDFLDWLPKVGYNSFFFQFKTPHTFLKRWYDYSHAFCGEWSEETSKRLLVYFDTLMEERGLLRHRMGHGWTAEIIGAKNTYGWDNEELRISEDIKSLIAYVNGKRELFKGVAVNTNLCLSNINSLNIFAKKVEEYLGDNPDTEYLHIWLADSDHNFCECQKCKDLRPADQYIALLNHLDSHLTKMNSKTKLCLLMYEDLFWPPIKNKLNNPKRFTLMFAPIHRSFNLSYGEVKHLPDIPPFDLNKTEFPKDVASNIAFLKGWKNTVDCDSFAFDYHLGRAHHSEPTHIKMAKIIYNDLKAYSDIELNGIISCQELRTAFPNALCNYVMGKTSMNLKLTFDEIAKEYYHATYGDSGEELFLLMEKLSSLFDCDYINYHFCPTPRINNGIAENMEKVPSVLESIENLIDNHQRVSYPVQSYMWEELRFFISYTGIFAEIVKLRSSGLKDKSIEVFESRLKPLITKHEVHDQASLDVARVIHTINLAIAND